MCKDAERILVPIDRFMIDETHPAKKGHDYVDVRGHVLRKSVYTRPSSNVFVSLSLVVNLAQRSTRTRLQTRWHARAEEESDSHNGSGGSAEHLVRTCRLTSSTRIRRPIVGVAYPGCHENMADT